MKLSVKRTDFGASVLVSSFRLEMKFHVKGLLLRKEEFS